MPFSDWRDIHIAAGLGAVVIVLGLTLQLVHVRLLIFVVRLHFSEAATVTREWVTSLPTVFGQILSDYYSDSPTDGRGVPSKELQPLRVSRAFAKVQLRGR